MAQKFYQKASVQVAIVTSIGLFLVTTMTILHQRSQLKADNQKLQDDNQKLQYEVNNKSSEIQRLETQLIPFRTLALEKYTGSENQALRKLSDDILHLYKQDQSKSKQIETLKSELADAKSMAKPANLVFYGYELENTELGLKIILQFKPTKNEKLGRIDFEVSLTPNSKEIIKNIQSILNPTVGENSSISNDGKSAKVSFALLGTGLPTLEIIVSGPTSAVVDCNFFEKPFDFDVNLN